MFNRRLAYVLAGLVAGCSAPAATSTHTAQTPTGQQPSSLPQEVPAVSTTQTADQLFETLAASFLDQYLALSPIEATIAGEHRHDAKWPDVSAAGDAALKSFLVKTGSSLVAIDRAKLSQQNRVDASILDTQLRYGLFSLGELRERELNPVYYTDLIGSGLDPLITRSFGTKASRLASLRGRLEGIPAIVAAAKQRLAHPAKVHTETAIQQNAGLVSLVEADLYTQFATAADERAAIEPAAKKAAAALKDFQTFLEKDLLARSDGSFRLGRDKFQEKLRFALEDDVDIDALAASARALLVQTQTEMVETSKQIWTAEKLGKLPKLDTDAARKKFVKKVLDHVAKDRSTNATIVADAKAWVDKATAFVREHDLVRVPTEPVSVIEMPEYRRGVAIAYCDSSGPLEAKPETFFTISPTPKDWPAKRVESFYREYNQAMLADLSIHEAMPGHYLQLMHNNQFKSKIRAVFGSGPFVEGWAVYTEWLMAEKGFGGPRVKLQRQKMVLRMAANAILDHDIHAGTMEEKDALALMMGEAFQEEGEAVGKWKRARLTSAQLTTYYYGFSELFKLRQAAEKQPGFSERAYHDRLLSWGSPAIKYVRELVQTAATN